MNKSKKYSFIRYSNCWEDTEVLLDALDIHKGETGLSVASAGDNSIAMLIKDPAKIYVFDLNKTQLYCTELKMACFRALTYNEMLGFLGIDKCDRLSLYKKLEPLLGDEAKQYFAENMKIIKRGIIHVGKFERFFRIFRNAVIPIVCGKRKFARFASFDKINEQLDFYHKHINNRRLKLLFGIFFGYKVLGALGRDKDFYKYVEEKKESGNDIKNRFEEGLKNSPNNKNPYICYITHGTYDRRALPLYLREEYFEAIKERIGRIELICSDFASVKATDVDFVNLSDIFEYMDKDEFARNITVLADITNPDARIAYWNMQNKRYTEDKRFTREYKKAQELFTKSKACFYRDLCILRKANTNE